MTIKIYLTILVWIGLPGLFYGYIAFSGNPVPAKNIGLMLLYLTFSWSIALLIFVVETTRQGVFRHLPPLHSSLRLGIYACIAIILVIITMPESAAFQPSDLLSLTIAGLLYGIIMGYIYQRVVNRVK